jgi:Leucine-rich repeat (LRR) protein
MNWILQAQSQNILQKCNVNDFDQSICVLDSTPITSPAVVIVPSTSANFKNLRFRGNRKTTFLSIQNFKNFPDLHTLDASRCGIKEISKSNFEKLFRLKELWLWSNQIERIPVGTFDDLLALEMISMGESMKV